MRRLLKYFLTLNLLFITSFVYSHDYTYWTRIPSPVNAQLYKASYSDLQNIWAAGDSGVIVHTSDGGVNWTAQNSTIRIFISDIFFLNSRLGWAIANDYFYTGTIVLNTTNGGITWVANRFPDTTYIINTVYYQDSLTGFLSGYDGLILRTTNGGSNWTKSTIIENLFSQFPIRSMTFYNSQVGLACGGIMDIAGLVWKTTDSGLNWYSVDTTAEPLYSVKFYNYPKTYACGGDFEYGGTFSTSTNVGETWHNRNTTLFGIGQAIAFRNLQECWVPLGFSRSWMYSLDSTHSWNLKAAPDTSGIYDAFFIDGDHGWAFGDNGSILKYNAPIGIENNHTISATSFKLEQNYPNPFNPNSKIKIQSSKFADIKVIIYDISGKKVSTLIEQKLNPGTYELNIDGTNFSSGVYFYSLIVDGKLIDTKKMVYLK